MSNERKQKLELTWIDKEHGRSWSRSPNFDSEAIDFRVASELFAPVRKLKPSQATMLSGYVNLNAAQNMFR